MSALGMQLIRLDSTAATVASQNSVLERIYADRQLFTHSAPVLNIGGTNPDPDGTYQLADPPTTPMEKAYHLVNDPKAEGFKKWAITY